MVDTMVDTVVVTVVVTVVDTVVVTVMEREDTSIRIQRTGTALTIEGPNPMSVDID